MPNHFTLAVATMPDRKGGMADSAVVKLQAITRAIEAQDRLVEEAKTGIVETALGTNECAPALANLL